MNFGKKKTRRGIPPRATSTRPKTTNQATPPPNNPIYTGLPTPSSSANTMPDDTLVHKLTSVQSTIPPFAGRKPDGNLSTDLNQWISQVESHITVNSSNATPAEQLQEAKRFLDFAAGDLSRFASTQRFLDLTSWQDLATYLKTVYATIDQKDAVSCLATILAQWKSTQKSYKELQTPVFSMTREWLSILKQSDSSEDVNGTSRMNTEDVAILFNLGLILGALPTKVIRSLTRKWTRTDGPHEIDMEVRKHTQSLPD